MVRLVYAALGRSMLAASAVLLVLCPTVDCLTGSAAEELLRLVPEDAALGLVVRDLRQHAQQLTGSPFLQQFQVSVLGKALAATPEAQKLSDFDRQLQTHLKVNLIQVRDDLLGDALVFAYWPANKGGAERGLFLTKARKPELLASVAQRLNALQLRSGDLTSSETVMHKGFKYVRSVDRLGKPSVYCVHEGLFVLTQDESVLQRVLDTLAAPTPANPLAQRLGELGVLDAFAAFWVHPRAFDAEMQAKAAASQGKEAAFLRNFQRYWKQTTGLALALRLDNEVKVSVSIRMNAVGLSPAAQRFFDQAAKPSRLWSYVPERTVLAMAGRFDLPALIEMLGEFVPEEGRQKALDDLNRGTRALLGMDLHKELLPMLGPDWCFYLTLPPADQVEWFPDVVLAIQASAQPDQRKPEESLTGALRTLLGLLALIRSNEGKQPTDLTTDTQGTVQVISLASAGHFPAGFQPGGAVKSSCLALASSPKAIQRFGETPGSPQPSAGPEVLLARLSMPELLAFFKDEKRSKGLLKALAQGHQATPQDVRNKLDNLLPVLGLVEQVELRQRVDPGQLTLRLQLRLASPLRKNPAPAP